MGTEPGRTGRWLKIALFASLTMNVLIICAVIGVAVTSLGGGENSPRVRDRTLFPLIAMLPREDRAALGLGFGMAASGRGAADEGWQQTRNALYGEILADPFDADRFAAHLAARRMIRGDEAARLEQALARHIAAMEAADRQAYAERLMRLGGHKQGGNRRDRP
ncbi:MAG: periplasmic heavy metal sensor [Qingshengfaniella sp.]